MNLGTPEIIMIVLVVLLLFGATRLPQLARSLGQTKKAFKEGLREAEEEEKAEQRTFSSVVDAPQLSQMSDDEIQAELKRRTESKTIS